MRLAIITAVWRRGELAACSLERWRRVLDEIAPAGYGNAATIVVAGSEGEASARLAQHADALYVEVPNQPLSAKWEAALAVARAWSPDAVMLLGSDDWITHAGVVELAAAALEHGYAGLADMYFHDLPSGLSRYWPGYSGHRFGETIGAGRTLSADVLERIDWRPWRQPLRRGLDWEMTTHLRAAGVEPARLEGARCLLDVKDDESVTAFDAIAPARCVEPAELDEQLGAGTAAQLERLRSSLGCTRPATSAQNRFQR